MKLFISLTCFVLVICSQLSTEYHPKSLCTWMSHCVVPMENLFLTFKIGRQVKDFIFFSMPLNIQENNNRQKQKRQIEKYNISYEGLGRYQRTIQQVGGTKKQISTVSRYIYLNICFKTNTQVLICSMFVCTLFAVAVCLVKQ